MNEIKEFDAAAIRDYVNTQTVYEHLRQVRMEARHRYGGSLKFERRKNSEYLIYRSYGSSAKKSLGRRNPETERIFQKYSEGRTEIEDRIDSLERRLDEFAPILKARNLGRVPDLTARVLRKLDHLGWLGKIVVIGSNAMFGFETKAGVSIESDVLATDDLDILYDTRRKLTFAGELNETGFIGVLQTVDRSFKRKDPTFYSAINKEGFVIDLLEPQDHQKIMKQGQTGMSEFPNDLIATATDNSGWIFSTPKFESTVIDEKGYPLWFSTLDPRVFALLKLWMSKHSRYRNKPMRSRDEIQARVAAVIAKDYLELDFDSKDLSGVPFEIRKLASEF